MKFGIEPIAASFLVSLGLSTATVASAAEPCHCADLAPPEGVVDAADLEEYLTRANTNDAKADFVAPFGVVDFFDVLAFLKLMDTAPVEPNVLWLSFEDTSWYALPAYGQTAVSTPNLDERFFSDAVRFDRAWSTAPVCSPARSTLISGSYATTYGSDFHRRSINVPADQYFFPRLLQANGYFTTNNRKTDYNAVQNSQAWNQNNNSASWTSSSRNGRPFFSVYNSNHTHTGRVRSWHTDGRRDFSAAGINPTLPPHVPDLPDVYSDLQFHLEGIQGIDEWVGRHLDRLEQAELDDQTVVFVFADHGGLLPRGKGYVFETGLRVPFGVRVPARLRCLLPDDLRTQVGRGSDRLVGFVDFAATVLSLAGVESPAHIQGKAFLGEHAEPARDYQFAFVTNREGHFAPDRAVTDGRYKYIRRFIPHRHHGNRNNYQWGMPAWIAWDDYVYAGPADNEIWMRPYTPNSDATKAEMLFDIQADPYETLDLSEDPARQADLARLRTQLEQHMRTTMDLGLFPDNMRDIYSGAPIYDWVRQANYDVDGLITAAWLASNPTPADTPTLLGYLNDDDRALKFWGAVGYASLAATGQIGPSDLPGKLDGVSGNGNWQVASAAAEAKALGGDPSELDRQITRILTNNNAYAYSAIETLTRFDHVAPEILSRSGDLQAAAPSNFKARAIMVNLGQYPPRDLFAGQYNNGLGVNQDIRDIGPLP
ncbi:MAG: sulfatase [Planctomycetota bacterium]